MPELNENTLKNLLGDDPIATSISVRIRQDEQTLANLERHFTSLRREAEGIARALKEAGIAAQNLGVAGGGGGKGVSAIGSTKVEGGPFKTTPIDKGLGTQVQIESKGGGKSPTPPSTLSKVAGYAAQALSVALPAMDTRIERGYQYSLAADRVNMLFQQMKGMSQTAIQDTYRQPLTQYKLGVGGINSMLALEAGTGMAARQQAASVEALRVSSGFSVNAPQAASILEQLASPQVANRMFMMTGMSIVRPGGGYRTLNELMQSLVKSQGLTDPRLVKSALMPGSVTRANLTNIGVTGELQTQLIQYAQQNLAFKQRGGSGMYDPSNKAHQKIMGIDRNFAMQAEETDRVRGAREEQFYSRQADNFADLEKQTQKLIRTLGALEDRLSGVFGLRTSTQVGSNFLGRALSMVLPVAGAALGGMTGNPGLALAGYTAGQTLASIVPKGDGFTTADRAESAALKKASGTRPMSSAFNAGKSTKPGTGQPVSPSSSAKSQGTFRQRGATGFKSTTSFKSTSSQVNASTGSGKASPVSVNTGSKFQAPSRYSPMFANEISMAFTPGILGNKRMTQAEMLSKPEVINMNPDMVKTLFSALTAYQQETGDIAGIGSGYRSYQEQLGEWLNRYTAVNYDTGLSWNGQFWKKNNDHGADLAPPGSAYSNHEHGLAADLVAGNTKQLYAWLEKNASKYGLEWFGNVNNEPWHVQLAGLRASGEGGGAGYNERSGFSIPGIGLGEEVDTKVLRDALMGVGLESKARMIDKNGLTNVMYSALSDPSNPLSGISDFAKVFGNQSGGKALPKRGTMSPDSMERWLKSVTAPTQKEGVAGLTISRGKPLSNQELMKVLYTAGFRGDALIQMFAIARRESGGDPFATNFKNELSYGLFQHNMDPNTTSAEGNRIAWGLSSNEDLLDPLTNARVAFEKYNWYSTHGNKNGFEPWGPYRGMHQLGGGAASHIPDAIATAQKLGYVSSYTGPMGPGDGVPPSNRPPKYRPELQPLPSLPNVGGTDASGAMSNYSGSYHPGNNITIAPTINISTSGGSLDQDLERVARKVAAMLEREVNRTMIRRT